MSRSAMACGWVSGCVWQERKCHDQRHHSACDRPTAAYPPACRSQIEAVEAIDAGSQPRRAVLGVVTDVVRRAGAALLNAWRLNGSLSYFDFDRPSRQAPDLGAALTWESDSFW